jgi:adenylate cyclase
VTIVLDAIRPCLEGVTPALLATVAADGTPNVSYLSQVHYVDPEHVALSFQFFNKTRENVLATRRGLVRVYDPDTAAQYQIALEYLRTETEGPLFEGMKAKLAGIASHTGMSKVFRLRGSDVFRVLEIVKVLPDAVCPPAPRPSLLQALRTACRRLARCTDLDSLLGETLSCLREQLGIPLGAGVIGVAARERTPIRITHLTGDASYSRAARESCSEAPGQDLEMEIPLPGLAEARSQMAMPILARGKLLGVIHLESTRDMRFTSAE